MSWQPGPVDLWWGWSEWHRDAEQSAGSAPPREPATAAPAALPPRVAALFEVYKLRYERLHAARPQP